MKKQGKKASVLSRILKVIGILLLIAVLLAAGLVAFLSITEYRPAEREAVSPTAPFTMSAAIEWDKELTLMTWNVGYGALGSNADFFMDGGRSVYTAEPFRVSANLTGMVNAMREADPDFLLLQEADVSSWRSRGVDEPRYFLENLGDRQLTYAPNFMVEFLPYPIPPIGKVHSGVATLSKYRSASSERVQLPVPFGWPMRLANLKRCLLIDRIPIENSDKQLVLINLHLEAYDDGEGNAAQLEALLDVMEQEAANGNFVIAGGDFNRMFSTVDPALWPHHEGLWECKTIDVGAFGGWQCLMDPSVPTCRSLYKPIDNADRQDFQYYMLDGFIVSDNVRVNLVKTLDKGFTSSDHNPVLLKFELGFAR